MSDLIVKWNASDSLRFAECIATGHITNRQREKVFDLTTLTPDQRKAVVEIASETGRPPAYVIDLTERYTPAAHPPAYSVGAPCNWYTTQYDIRFDAEPSLEQALALGAQNALVLDEARSNALAAQEVEDRQKAEKKAREDAEKTAATARMTPLYRQIQPAAEAAIAGDSVEAIEAIYASWPEGLHYNFAPDGGDSLDKRLSARKAELIKEWKQAAKLAWVRAYGSDHLKRAVAAGHNCDRLYWIERCAKEYPGATLDYEKNAGWKDRSCPSVGMLDQRDAILAAHPGVSATIVWLTGEPLDHKRDDEYFDYEPFGEREGIVVDDSAYSKYIVF
jgi:hypothetical protein